MFRKSKAAVCNINAPVTEQIIHGGQISAVYFKYKVDFWFELCC